MPDFRHPQRGRYKLRGGEEDGVVGTGWLLIEGPWLHMLDDEYAEGDGGWQSWPSDRVAWVEWDVSS
jgi:hypothetical protein